MRVMTVVEEVIRAKLDVVGVDDSIQAEERALVSRDQCSGAAAMIRRYPKRLCAGQRSILLRKTAGHSPLPFHPLPLIASPLSVSSTAIIFEYSRLTILVCIYRRSLSSLVCDQAQRYPTRAGSQITHHEAPRLLLLCHSDGVCWHLCYALSTIHLGHRGRRFVCCHASE